MARKHRHEPEQGGQKYEAGNRGYRSNLVGADKSDVKLVAERERYTADNHNGFYCVIGSGSGGGIRTPDTRIMIPLLRPRSASEIRRIFVVLTIKRTLDFIAVHQISSLRAAKLLQNGRDERAQLCRSTSGRSMNCRRTIGPATKEERSSSCLYSAAHRSADQSWREVTTTTFGAVASPSALGKSKAATSTHCASAAPSSGTRWAMSRACCSPTLARR